MVGDYLKYRRRAAEAILGEPVMGESVLGGSNLGESILSVVLSTLRGTGSPARGDACVSVPVRRFVLAAVLSGVPSTVHALAVGDDPLRATRAAGSLVGGGVAEGVVVHLAVSASGRSC